MALNLDTRQRAILQEMGITVWLPKTAAPAVTPAPAPAQVAILTEVNTPAAATAATAPGMAHTPALTAPAVAMPTAMAPAPAPATDTTAAAPVWQMAAPVQAYPEATQGTPEDAWLVIWECDSPATPLEGDSGKLLNNMLRALRLHHSRHVWIACLQRPGHQALPVVEAPNANTVWDPLAQALPSAIAHSQPARILLLGMHAARAVLGSQEALGRLRAQVHQVHHIPTVVSYDPAYLLRSPHAKPAAWADLCRAHALRPPSAL